MKHTLSKGNCQIENTVSKCINSLPDLTECNGYVWVCAHVGGWRKWGVCMEMYPRIHKYPKFSYFTLLLPAVR